MTVGITAQRCAGIYRWAVINRFIAEINSEPKPFVWTADPDPVIAAVKRGKETSESIPQILFLKTRLSVPRIKIIHEKSKRQVHECD